MKYRNKSVVIDAIQLNRGNIAKVCEFLGIPDMDKSWRTMNPLKIDIETLEGTVIASELDWIIHGVEGEYYTCKPDIFEQTYKKED